MLNKHVLSDSGEIFYFDWIWNWYDGGLCSGVYMRNNTCTFQSVTLFS